MRAQSMLEAMRLPVCIVDVVVCGAQVGARSDVINVEVGVVILKT
jgi:hypothetical protein